MPCSTEGVTPIATTKTLTGGYTGTITPRGVTVKFANATKIYDGTDTVKDFTYILDARVYCA